MGGREGEGGGGGGCSGAHSSPEQYTGLPATPPHKGGCLATGTYRPMAAGPGPAAPDGCTAGPHSRAIGGRLLVSRRDTHVPARAGAGRSRTPRALGAQQHSSKRCVAAPKEPPGCPRPQTAGHASWPAACPAAATSSGRGGSRVQLGAPSACQRRRRREPPTPHAVRTRARQGSSTRCESSSEGATLGRA